MWVWALVHASTVVQLSGSPEQNRAALVAAFAAHAPGDVLVVPAGSVKIAGGAVFEGPACSNVELRIEGKVSFPFDLKKWPSAGGTYNDALHFVNCSHLTIRGPGSLDGDGAPWWDRYDVGAGKKKRPKLVVVKNATDVLVDGLTLHNSPSWHLLLGDVRRAEVSRVTVETDRAKKASKHAPAGGLQPEDLNTDGIDVAGRDIWIHDCHVVNDDDSVAIKPTARNGAQSDCTENVLVENMVLKGFGASIGSVPPHAHHNCVRNITFRNISMPETAKGIYIKSNPSCAADGSKTAEITNVLYEDVSITSARWWPVWIGPQQQHEPGKKLSGKCPLDFPISPTCPTQGCVRFANITLRRVRIDDPWFSPGVVLGNASAPMEGVVFDDVVVNFREPGGWLPYKRQYKCEHVQGRAVGKTHPVPPCFRDETTRVQYV